MPHRPVRWEIDSAPGLGGPAGSREEIEKQARVLQLIHAYRVRGHLVADLDPLDSKRAPHKDLDPATYGLTIWDLDREFITERPLRPRPGHAARDPGRPARDLLRHDRRRVHVHRRPRAQGVAPGAHGVGAQHPALDAASRGAILEKLVEAESFERFLHAKYVGHKRFSLEGGEALIPLLDRILSDAAREGVKEVVIGMAHRGRLNVLANTVGKPLAQIFSEFEGEVDPDSTQGSGDVKYHLGATGTHRGRHRREHDGHRRPEPEPPGGGGPGGRRHGAGQAGRPRRSERARVIPILLHGDAAFAGQGIVAETLNLAGLDGYRTGGTIHVVVNNQIGFTTLPQDARSSTYCTDVAKMVQPPSST